MKTISSVIAVIAAMTIIAPAAHAQSPLQYSDLPGQKATPDKHFVETVTFYCDGPEAGAANMALGESRIEEEPAALYCFGYADIDREPGDEVIRVDTAFTACEEKGCPLEIFKFHGGRWRPSIFQVDVRGVGYRPVPRPRTFARTFRVEHRGSGLSTIMTGDGRRFAFDGVLNTGQGRLFEQR